MTRNTAREALDSRHFVSSFPNCWTMHPRNGIIVITRSALIPGERPLFWVGSSKSDLMDFPEPVKDEMGIALSVAQFGGGTPERKTLEGAWPRSA